MSKLIEQYSQLSIDITKELSKAEKKDNGIFISPKIIITKLFDSIIKYASENEISIQTILEPSCGTCEIVNYCDNIFNGVHIDAVEFNDKIFERIKGINFKNNVTLIHQDFIKFNSLIKYDLIVGNPPYFVLEKNYKINEKMKPYIYGRPNIFGFLQIFASH